MKLSEAILSFQGPQKFGPPSLTDTPGDGLCALAGAAHVIGMDVRDCFGANWPQAWRDTMRIEVPVPCVCRLKAHWLTDDLGYLITHLNDKHQWTKEQIADLVEMYETEAQNAADIHKASFREDVTKDRDLLVLAGSHR